VAGLGRRVWAADEVLSAEDLQDYIQDQVVFVYDTEAARTSGILSPTEGMISYLKNTNLLYAFDGSNWVEIAPNVGTPGTYTKVTTDAKGRVTSGTTLAAGDIPNLDASKTTSGSFDAARIPNLDGSKITSGTITVGVVAGANNVSGNTVSAINLTASNDVTASAALRGTNIDVSGGVFFSGVYNQTNTGRAVFVASNGTLGIGSSSERFKKNIVDADIDVDAVKQVRVKNFVYDPKFVESDGSVQVGVIAEDLVSLGLSEFVFFDEDGKPEGVAYERLCLMLLPLVQSLDERVSKLESK
jgi:hypothetical protein